MSVRILHRVGPNWKPTGVVKCICGHDLRQQDGLTVCSKCSRTYAVKTLTKTELRNVVWDEIIRQAQNNRQLSDIASRFDAVTFLRMVDALVECFQDAVDTAVNTVTP